MASRACVHANEPWSITPARRSASNARSRRDGRGRVRRVQHGVREPSEGVCTRRRPWRAPARPATSRSTPGSARARLPSQGSPPTPPAPARSQHAGGVRVQEVRGIAAAVGLVGVHAGGREQHRIVCHHSHALMVWARRDDGHGVPAVVRGARWMAGSRSSSGRSRRSRSGFSARRFGAQLAAALGLPYAFASHFAPAALVPAIQVYRERFQPSTQLDQPHDDRRPRSLREWGGGQQLDRGAGG